MVIGVVPEKNPRQATKSAHTQGLQNGGRSLSENRLLLMRLKQLQTDGATVFGGRVTNVDETNKADNRHPAIIN